MKKIIKLLTLILIAFTLISGYFYYLQGGLWLKSLTSFGFVATGLANLIYALKEKACDRFVIFTFCGLFFSFLGDIVINLSFIPGAFIFALGHVFYFAAFCSREGFSKRDFVYVAAMLVISLTILLLYPGFNFDTLILCVCVFYSIIISFMAGKAISGYFANRSAVNLILAIGAILFFSSDAALVLYMFGNAGKAADTVCLFTYFPAQCMLAYGMHKYLAKKL